MKVKYLKVSEIVKTVSDTHSYNFDKLYAVNTSDVEKGNMLNIPLINTNDLKGQFKKSIKKNDILFSEIRPANEHYAIVKIDNTEQYVASTKLMVLRKYNNDVDLMYFYYWLTNKSMLNILQSRAENRICSFPQITFELLSEYLVPVPSLKIQKKISEILSAIDNKISTNNRINSELESMAKTIYDYWFTQFDFPDENGKPYRSSGGKMIWNEELKREIPEGWGVTSIGQITSCLDSQRIPLSSKDRENKKGSIPYYGATGIMDYVDEAIFDGDYVLMAEDGSVMNEKGNPILQRVSGQIWVNNHAHVLQPTGEHCCKLLMLMLKDIQVSKIKTGSIQMKINKENMNNIIVPDIPNDTLSLANKYFDSIDRKKLDNEKENQQLASLRDWLLPMLMNGQVGFKEKKQGE